MRTEDESVKEKHEGSSDPSAIINVMEKQSRHVNDKEEKRKAWLKGQII